MNPEDPIGIIELGNINIKCLIFRIINDNTEILSTSITPSSGFHNDVVINLSNLISTEDYYDYNSLPNIFGEGAENNFVKFYKELKTYNFPIGTIKNYYYFQIGRWDLELLN